MMPIGPATRIYLAAGATDLRNHSERLIIPSPARKDPKTRCLSRPSGVNESE